jgi:hypothetical protein
MLRNHAGLVAGLFLALTLALLPVLPGCADTTASTITPGHKVDRTGLAAEAATQQAAFDAQAGQLRAAETKYNADVTAYNAKLAAAGSDLQHKAELKSQLVSAVGSFVPALLSGKAMDPTTYTSFALTLLALGGGGGAVVDSKQKQSVINRLRATPGGSDSSNVGGAAADVQPAALAGSIRPTPEPVNVPKAA